MKYAIKIRDEWYVAELVPASSYRGLHEGHAARAWSELHTTNYLGEEGEASNVIELEKPRTRSER